MKKFGLYLFGFIAFVAFTSCNEASIEGRWVEPVPGMEGVVQGVNLEEGGKAISINMATLQYEKWKKLEDKLNLAETSIGNQQTNPLSDTLVIGKLTVDELTLKKGNFVVSYKRQ